MALRLQAALTACNVTTICNISCPRYSRSSGTKTWSSLSPVTQHMSTKSGMQINIYVLSDSPVPHLIWDYALSLSRGNALHSLLAPSLSTSTRVLWLNDDIPSMCNIPFTADGDLTSTGSQGSLCCRPVVFGDCNSSSRRSAASNSSARTCSLN